VNAAETLHGWYSVGFPVWVPILIAVAAVLILSALAVDPDRRVFCPVHKAQGILVGIKAAPCVLCQFPEVKR
jgi:hypothetical protein